MKEYLVRAWIDLEHNIHLDKEISAENPSDAVSVVKKEFPGLQLYVAYVIEDGEIVG